MSIRDRNLLQAYQLKTLVGTLPPSENWSLELSRSDKEDKMYMGLLKDKERMYVTFDPLAMRTYIQALIALEGKIHNASRT